jgi:hypothetical protein
VYFRRISYASYFSIHCRTRADRNDWRFNSTDSKQTHTKGMLQFTNMRHGMQPTGRKILRIVVPAASIHRTTLQVAPAKRGRKAGYGVNSNKLKAYKDYRLRAIIFRSSGVVCFGGTRLAFGYVEHHDFEAVMSSDRYRKNAEECLDRAAGAGTSEDTDAWLLIAEEWLRLAVEFDAVDRQSG